MDRYAHSDQVSTLVAGLRARVFGLIDIPGFPDDAFDAVMTAFDQAEGCYVTWSSEEEIAREYLEAIEQD